MKASIVIPTRNAGAAFASVLSQLSEQEFDAPFETLVIDSGSGDGTLERATQAGVRVHRIAATAFNHGRVRNLGVELTEGEAVVFLSQDARPLDRQWLSRLLEPLGESDVAGVSGRVVPSRDASPLVARSVRADLAYRDERIQNRIEDLADWKRWPAARRRAHAHFNNVASCAKRSVLHHFPFPERSFGEDLAWAVRVLEAGFALVHEPGAVVVHSHPSALLADYRRHRSDAALLGALFGTRPSLRDEARAALGAVWGDWQILAEASSWPDRLAYGLYSPCLRTAQALGRIVGAREGDTREK